MANHIASPRSRCIGSFTLIGLWSVMSASVAWIGSARAQQAPSWIQARVLHGRTGHAMAYDVTAARQPASPAA